MRKKQWLIFCLITLISFFLRFHNFDEYINFHLDPPRFLHEAKDMVESGKLRLVGQMVTSKEIGGRLFFAGPTMYYILAILGVISNWNVTFITAFFAAIWIITFILIFFWLRRRFGNFIALTVYALLSFFHWLIPFSRIIWDPTFIPFFGFFFFLFLEKREKKRLNYFWAGLFFGLGLSVSYISGLWFLVIFYYLFHEARTSKFVAYNWFYFLIGALIPSLPFLCFELRHGFYNLKTIIFQIRYYKPDQTYSLRYYYYYVFPLLPLICKAYGLVLEKIMKRFGPVVLFGSQIILILVFLGYSLFGPHGEALINPVGWTIKRQQEIADLIVQDSSGNFEVAAVVGPETRANELRWWLRMKNRQPLGVEDYEKTDILYLVAPLSRPPEKETVWEVRVLRPFEIVWQKDLGEEIYLYKLVRQNKEPVLK